jgi:hypothetical protein
MALFLTVRKNYYKPGASEGAGLRTVAAFLHSEQMNGLMRLIPPFAKGLAAQGQKQTGVQPAGEQEQHPPPLTEMGNKLNHE